MLVEASQIPAYLLEHLEIQTSPAELCYHAEFLKDFGRDIDLHPPSSPIVWRPDETFLYPSRQRGL